MEEPTFFADAQKFRDWLEKKHNQEKELWVGFYKKNSGKANMTWSESVDQALCFGWIDGIRKSIDGDSYKIRFTPRKPKSNWSAVNLKKMEELTKNGLMRPPGKAIFEKREYKRTEVYSFEQDSIELKKAYEQKIKTKPKAWKFYNKLAPSYKKASIWWVISAKQEATRVRRLEVLIQSSEEGLKIPHLRRAKK